MKKIAIGFAGVFAALLTVTLIIPDRAQPEIQTAPVVASSLDELVEGSTHVVTGRYTNKKAEIHVPSTGSNGEADNRLVGVGTVYTVEVESYLKGDGGREIQVVQFEQYRTQEPGAPLKVLESASARFPLERNGRYLLFLSPQGQVGSMPDLFLGVAETYRFKLESGEAKVDGPLGDLFRGLHEGRAAIFPDTSEQSLLSQVKTIVARPPGN